MIGTPSGIASITFQSRFLSIHKHLLEIVGSILLNLMKFAIY